MITIPSVVGFAAWSWWERSVERERVDLTVVAPTVGEIKTIAHLAKLETQDMERIYQQISKQKQRCAIDDFSAIVESVVTANKEKRAAEKAKAKQMKTAEDDDDDDEDEDEEEEKKEFHGWHLLALYRLSQTDALQTLPMDELFTGLAVLAQDLKPEDERVVDPKLSKPSLLRANINPWARLNFAWRVADVDRDEVLSFEQFTSLLTLLIREGHFDRESLVHRDHFGQPFYRALEAKEIGEQYFRLLKRQPPFDQKCISWQEFKNVTTSLQTANSIPRFWYFETDFRVGFFRRTRLRWTEKAMNFLHSLDLYHNPALAPDPTIASMVAVAVVPSPLPSRQPQPRAEEEDDDDEDD